MAIIVNDDKLKCILTSYGLGRVAEALQDKEVNLNLSKIKIGDGKGEYYEPQEIQKELRGPIKDGEFFITEKELLEDKLTVSFHTVISETFGNCDIREVGLYETIDGVDYLFAISTQQPMVKPGAELNYFITIDYYLFLKSANLADVYEQIVLNPEDQLVTTQDLEDLMSTILFTEGNLMAQINQNSHIIGLNRATQLYERMETDKETYGYASTYANYTSLLNYVNPDNVFGYWVFNYPRRSNPENSIIDINKYNYNFSSDKAINLYKKVYQNLIPSLRFEKQDYFYLGSGPLMNFVDDRLGKDISSTMIFVINPITKGVTRTLLARSNYATGSHVFEVNEKDDNSVEVKIFSDKNNYLIFTTKPQVIPNECHVLAISYNSDSLTFKILINGMEVDVQKTAKGSYSHMNTTPETLYCFSCIPKEIIYANSSTEPVEHLYNKDGSVYAGTFWTISEGKVYFRENKANYSISDNTRTPLLYAWNYNDGVSDHIIYTKDEKVTEKAQLFNSDYSGYTGSKFKIVYGGSKGYVIQYDTSVTEYDASKNIQPKILYAWIFTTPIEKIWTNAPENPVVLLTEEGEIYRGDKWAIVDSKVILNKRFIASYDSQYNIQADPLNASSYIINKEGQRAQFIDSEIGIISVIMKELNLGQMRDISLNIISLLGYNPCVVPNKG